MSTTHVASGAIFGIAVEQSMTLPRKLIAGMIIAWVVTIPVAGLLSVIVLMVLTKTLPFAH
jgi:phosphate/sulfate permease